ncbi:MAG: hypothetical protein AAF975_03725, partial [Spirochaetota bacterium]
MRNLNVLGFCFVVLLSSYLGVQIMGAQEEGGQAQEELSSGSPENAQEPPNAQKAQGSDRPQKNPDTPPNSAEQDKPEDLLAQVALGPLKAAAGAGQITSYHLNYKEYPNLVAAFLYLAQQEPNLYQQVGYASPNQGSYGNSFPSLPAEHYSLPNFPSAPHSRPGLAFWRNGSVLRSDILLMNHSEVGVRDQNNLVFFATQAEKSSLKISPRRGLKLVGVEALGPEAKEFLEGLADIINEKSTYTEYVDTIWRDYMYIYEPEVSALLEETEGWERDSFGYYHRTVKQGAGRLPEVGEDLNINLERKALAGIPAQSLPVIVSFGRDTLPMPFAYFVGKSTKGSQVEILCPPSTARS